MRLIYPYIKLIYVNMRVNYVNMQHVMKWNVMYFTTFDDNTRTKNTYALIVGISTVHKIFNDFLFHGVQNYPIGS